MRWSGGERISWWVLAAASFLLAVEAEPQGYLLISAPRNGRISWVKLPEDGNFQGLSPVVLIDDGLRHPQGIAIDEKRKKLYVADPDVQKIYSYQLEVKGDMLTTDGRQSILAENAESRWVTVDGVGNVFFSDEPRNRILKVSAENVLRGVNTPEVVYSGGSLAEVSEPGGVAVDNFDVYWTNKRFGTQAGSLVRGREVPKGPAQDTVSVLAKNSIKSYGVCISLGNVFYTNYEKSVYGVKKTGGPVGEVTSSLKHPRGCAWDKDGTVYVADRGAGAVYSFPGNMAEITSADVTKSFDYEDAFGLAVIVAEPTSTGLLSGIFDFFR